MRHNRSMRYAIALALLSAACVEVPEQVSGDTSRSTAAPEPIIEQEQALFCMPIYSRMHYDHVLSDGTRLAGQESSPYNLLAHAEARAQELRLWFLLRGFDESDIVFFTIDLQAGYTVGFETEREFFGGNLDDDRLCDSRTPGSRVTQPPQD